MSGDKDVQTSHVRTLDELERLSDRFRIRYDNLSSAASDDPDRSDLIGRLKHFLKVCAEHGRYVPIGTPERRSLRNLVDCWTSRLSRDRYAVDDILGLVAYDPNAGVPLDVLCPYPGLEPYDDKRKGDFSGREKLAGEYAKNLEDQGVFLIIGGSGSGKSSVALAGVRPSCQQRHPDWCFPKPIKPGSRPLRALASTIAEETASDAEDLTRRLKEKPEDAASILGDALDHKPTLLIIDQFEEVLTLCRDSAAQKAFADALWALTPPDAPAGERRFYLLFTLRNDHLGRFDDNPDFKPLRDHLMTPACNANLPAMQQDEILQAILTPAQRVRLRFVPADVAQRLAGQTASLTNGLPLLQFALQRLWDGRDKEMGGNGRPLDFIHEKQLKDLPDISSALGTHAERVYEQFDAPQQRICQRLILELVFLDENFTEPVRRRRSKAGLVDAIGQALRVDSAAVCGVIEKFVRERLLREFSENREDQLEVAHEALLRHWKTIRDTVDSEKVRLFRIKAIQKEAADWERNARSADWLKQRGAPLTKVEQDVEEFYLIDPDSRAYVVACRMYEDELERKEDEKHKAEMEARDARVAQERAEREKAEAEVKRANAAQQVAEQQAQLREAEVQRAKVAQQVAEQQASLLEAERQKKDALEAKEIAERRKWQVILAAASVAIIGVVGVFVAKARNYSNVSALASLSDRLPSAEELDLTRTLAQKNEIFNGALGHALERMDEARIVGERESGLTLLGDGDGLLSVPNGPWQGKKICLYGLDELGQDKNDGGVVLSFPQGGCVEQSGQFERGNLGAEIAEDGPLKGKRLFVAIFRAKGGTLDAKAWLVDLKHGAGGTEPVTVSMMTDVWYYASQIAMRPDGREVSLGLVGKDGNGRLVTLELKGGPEGKTFRLEEETRSDGNGEIVAALGYVSDGRPGQQSRFLQVRATKDGLFCGDGKQRAHGVEKSEVPAIAIATAAESSMFAVGRGDGQIELARCDGGEVSGLMHETLRGNPSSVRLQRTEKARLLLSYQMTGGGIQCYEVSGEKLKLTSCNPNHPVGTAALRRKDSQVVIESAGGVPVIRRYPAEFALEKFRFRRAGLQGKTVLCGDGTVQSADNPGEGICVEDQSAGVEVALSPSAKFKAVMTREESRAKISVEKVSVGDGGAPSGSTDVEPKEVTGSLGVGSVFAIDDQGRLAYFRGSGGKDSELMIAERLSSQGATPTQAMIDGGPTCLSFSPQGGYLVVGTTNSGYRYAVKTGKPISPDADVKKVERISAAVTACAITDDGAAVFGLKDGGVLYFDRDFKQTELTKRVVYRLPAEVKAVRIDDGDSGRRVTALGAWQPNNCLYPALPGQALRVWVLDDKETGTIPVSTICFPNQPVLALGGWTTKPLPATPSRDAVSSGQAGAGAIASGDGIRLLLPQGVRWHSCPACRLKDESASDMQKRLVKLAEEKGGIVLEDKMLNIRYGLNLGLW